MMLDHFREIWLVDFEFYQPPGERPTPLCMVGREFRSGRLVRLWQDQLREMPQPPFSTRPDNLYVAYYASAELSCHLALGWPMPARILDLCAEFRCITSGLYTPTGKSLLGALTYYGLGGIDATEKDSMRDLAMRGGSYTADEQVALLDYCQSDVDALARLLPVMLPRLDVKRALVRGRYMAAVAKMEWLGVPIDAPTLKLLRDSWESIQDRLIARIDRRYGVFDGRTFKKNRWAAWLAQNNIAWPRLESGSLALDEQTFKEMARAYPAVAPIKELRISLSQLRLHELSVGADSRNRCLLSAFASKTGRNQPSTSKFIFGPAAWLRSLIKPTEGMAIAYVDYEQQEFAIAAALSGDAAMQNAYLTGDPYLEFAKQAGAVPPEATKETHKGERERFKVCALAVQYGMGAESLAMKLGDCTARGRELLRLHRETYPCYWKWSDAIADYAVLKGKLQAVFGWSVHVTDNANARSLRNFPLQANGGEMLRIACCLLSERGIRLCAPVHDAVLIESPIEQIDETVIACQCAMREASELVLSGFSLRTDAKIVRFPDRYSDKRGDQMWNTVQEIIGGEGVC